MFTGWFLLRFTANEVEEDEGYCQAELLKAIGYCWTATTGSLPLSAGDVRTYRKKTIELYAVNRGGGGGVQNYEGLSVIARGLA